MAPSVTPAAGRNVNLKCTEPQLSLPKHSYWYDFLLFVLFDVVFFFVMYFIVP